MNIDGLFADYLAIPSDLEECSIAALWDLFPDYISLPRKNSRKQELRECLENLRDKARQFCDLHREEFRSLNRGAVAIAKSHTQPCIVESVEVRWREEDADVVVHLCEMKFTVPYGYNLADERKLHLNIYSISWMLLLKDYRFVSVASIDFLNPGWMSKLKPLLMDIISQIPDTVEKD